MGNIIRYIGLGFYILFLIYGFFIHTLLTIALLSE